MSTYACIWIHVKNLETFLTSLRRAGPDCVGEVVIAWWASSLLEFQNYGSNTIRVLRALRLARIFRGVRITRLFRYFSAPRRNHRGGGSRVLASLVRRWFVAGSSGSLVDGPGGFGRFKALRALILSIMSTMGSLSCRMVSREVVRI